MENGSFVTTTGKCKYGILICVDVLLKKISNWVRKEGNMSKCTCPLCKRVFAESIDVCPICGYPYKYMVSIQRNDERIYTDLFFESIKKHDKYTAIKAIGVLEYLRVNGIELLYALIDEEDGNYDFAREKLQICLDREKRGSYMYVFCLEKMLECLAAQGNIKGTQELIFKNKDIYKDFWKSFYLIITAKKNSTEQQYEEYLNSGVENQLKEIGIFGDLTYKGNVKAENDIKDILVETFVDFIVLHERVIRIREVTKGKQDRSSIAYFRARIFNDVLEYCDRLFGSNEDLLPLLNEFFLVSESDMIGTEKYVQVCNKAAVKIRRYLFVNREKSADQTLKYIYYLLQIGAYEKAQRKMIRDNEAIYTEVIGNNYFAINLITELDILGFIKDESAGKLFEYRKNILSNDKDYKLEVVEKRIYGKLSSRGIYAFQIAEWMFNKSREEDYSWKDAGPIALNYFRIIELELNQKMVIPLLKNGKYKEISKVYKSEKKNLDEEGKEKLRNRFGRILGSLQQVSNPKSSADGLELGTLLYLIKNICIKEASPYQIGDKTGRFIFSEVTKLLTNQGKEALNSGELADLISDEKRERYRNPPAHTRYLPYSIACECRVYVMSSIYKLSDWFVL